jgi:hypothetical protein
MCYSAFDPTLKGWPLLSAPLAVFDLWHPRLTCSSSKSCVCCWLTDALVSIREEHRSDRIDPGWPEPTEVNANRFALVEGGRLSVGVGLTE